MPWIYNSTKDSIPVTLVDGTGYSFLPRKKVYLTPDLLPSEVWAMVHRGVLVNRGGDPSPVIVDTSSVHHVDGGSVLVDSQVVSMETSGESGSIEPEDSDSMDPKKEKRSKFRR